MGQTTFNPARDIPDQSGKVYFVTGGKSPLISVQGFPSIDNRSTNTAATGTAGLGAGCIEYLSAHKPAHIFFSGRSKDKAAALISKIHTTHPDQALTYIECDFKSLDSVYAAAKQVRASTTRLDVLMCNAGIMALGPETTRDGYEVQFQVNHLSHALTINTLLPLLSETAARHGGDARIVNLSSIAYDQAPRSGIEFATLRSKQASFGGLLGFPKWQRYGQSKLANLLYPAQLAKHHPDVTSVAVHPGVIMTDLFANVSLVSRLPAMIINWNQIIPVEQGPHSQLWASTCDKSKLVNGGYFEPVGVVGKRKTKHARNERLGDELWSWTQKALEKYS